MNTIYKIAKTELKILFYSPVAWLIIIIFTFQSALIFTGIYDGFVRRQALGWRLPSLTLSTFTGMRGLFTIAQSYLYLYIPLLTMGVMSRELNSGSIRLLYSSPLTNRQIVLGKYLALVFFALTLTGVLSLFALYSVITISAVDIPLILTGLLGLFLLICAYSAIGLFMSSLTTYTVVAAMGTLAIFALLNYMQGIGQDIEFVRDITYWLAIPGRSDTFIAGMITSEDILYFLTVIALFICFTLIRMQTRRQKNQWYNVLGKYALVTGMVILIGYFSSQPRFKGYYDATRTKVNTLTKSSQEIVSRLDGAVTITTYVNMLERNRSLAMPQGYKRDVERFEQYLRFKPDIKMQYVYYYHDAGDEQLDKQYPDLDDRQRIDTMKKIYNWKFPIVPYAQIQDQVNLKSEKFRFVRLIERNSGEKTFLRVFDDPQRLPSESEISAAFKRLTMERLPTVGFVTGHNERSSNSMRDRGYNMFAQEKTFRYSLINQGFNFEDITLDQKVPQHIRILVIAEPRKVMLPRQMAHLEAYIQGGGNLVIAGEPSKRNIVNPLLEPFGIQLLPGMLVKHTQAIEVAPQITISGSKKPEPEQVQFAPDLLFVSPTSSGAAFSHHLETMRNRELVMSMPTAGALKIDSNRGYQVVPLFTSDSTESWNELETHNFIDDTVKRNPSIGEIEQPYPVAVALSRQVGDKEQRILITSDADWLSNGELMMHRKGVRTSNFSLINGAFFWLTYEEVPVDMRRPPLPDRELRVGVTAWEVCAIGFKWIFPILLTIAAIMIWIRRKGK